MFCIGVIVFLSSCISLAEPNLATPTLDWQKLFIDVSKLPQGSGKSEIFEGCISAPLMSGCEDHQEKWVSYSIDENSRFMIEISYYKDEQILVDDFQNQFDLLFCQYPNYSEYFQPNEVDFHSDSSDRADFGCSLVEYESDNKNNCRYLGQYGQFLISSSMWFDEHTDYEIIQIILDAIDDRMSLYKNNPPILITQDP